MPKLSGNSPLICLSDTHQLFFPSEGLIDLSNNRVLQCTEYVLDDLYFGCIMRERPFGHTDVFTLKCASVQPDHSFGIGSVKTIS